MRAAVWAGLAVLLAGCAPTATDRVLDEPPAGQAAPAAAGPEPVHRYATPPPNSLSGGLEESSVAPPATVEELLARPSRVLVGTVTAEAPGVTTQDPEVPDSTSRSRVLTVEVEQALRGPASALVLTELDAYGPQGRRVVPGDRPRVEVGDRAVLLVTDVPHGPDVFSSFLLGSGHVVDTARGAGAWPLRSALESMTEDDLLTALRSALAGDR